MKGRLSLVLFLTGVMGGGLLIGWATSPGEWYSQLAKPPFNPPNWLFAPVWTVLYMLIAFVGWRIWRRNETSWLMKLWWAQLALNFLWSPVFFGAQQIAAALAIVLLLLSVIVGFVALCWRQDRTSALIFVPYAAWVAFASLLNGSILALN